jgi:hypothetical protein
VLVPPGGVGVLGGVRGGGEGLERGNVGLGGRVAVGMVLAWGRRMWEDWACWLMVG